MKRVGFLFDRIVDRDNLLLAYNKASRGKSFRSDRIAFAADLERNIRILRDGLIEGSYPVGCYTRFKIFDPKEREICAATFDERVLHHAVMNVCEPYFDKWMIFDTYASRKGKGQLKAVRRAREFSKNNRYFLKCDIRKYFDSIPHDRLITLLRRKFKDGKLLFWFKRIISSYEKTPGKGLPIGNLTSQHFANLFLDRIDRMYSPYVRYMDDFIFWSDDKDGLKRLRDDVSAVLEDDLGLELKPVIINHSSAGIDFLGMRVFPDAVRMSRESLQRYRRKSIQVMNGECDEALAQQRLTSLTAFVSQADSLAWRQCYFRKLQEREVCGEQPMAITA